MSVLTRGDRPNGTAAIDSLVNESFSGHTKNKR